MARIGDRMRRAEESAYGEGCAGHRGKEEYF